MIKALKICIGLLLFTSTSLYSQNDCEALNIVDVHIDPLGMNRLIINVENSSEDIFSYPGFKVFQDGMELGVEEVNFFGIGEQSTHFIVMENPFEDGVEVELTLELWTEFYDSLACTKEWTGKPYDTSECFEVDFQLQWAGGNGDFLSVVMYDQTTEEELFSTDEFFDIINPTYTQTICLEQACYIYKVTGTETLENNYYINIYGQNFFSYYYGVAAEGEQGVTDLIEVWEGCIAQNIEDSNQEVALTLYPNPANERITIQAELSISMIEVLDLNGKILHIAPESTIDISHLSMGYYLARVTFTNGLSVVKQIAITN